MISFFRGPALRLVAIAAIGTLILLDAMTVPLLVVLVLPYGAGQAIFGPAFSSIIPMIVPEEQLVEANSMGQTMPGRSSARLDRPIVGAAVVAVAEHRVGVGVDALTFGVSAVCIAMMWCVPRPRRRGTDRAVGGRARGDRLCAVGRRG